jgi:hypothetical protein
MFNLQPPIAPGPARASCPTMHSAPCPTSNCLTARAAEVAIALLGEHNRLLSSRRELRFRRKGSLAVVC